jgi:hypothetical protein
MLVNDLIVTEPDAIVIVGEGYHVVDERLTLRVVLWSSESLSQHLLGQLQERRGIK